MKRLACSILFTASLVSLAQLTACSSSDDEQKPAGTPGTVNQQSAKQSSTSMVTGVSTAIDSNNGNGSLAQLISGAQQAQGIVTPSAGTAPATTSFGGVGLRDALGTVSQALSSCDTACSGTSCTFNACSTDGAGSVVVNGTLSWTGGNLKCVNLTYDIDQSKQGGATTKITLDCDVTVTASTLKGYVKSTGSVSLGNLLADAGPAAAGIGNVSWTSNTQFNDVKYTAGKPTSGSVTVDATTTAGGQTYTGTANITYP